MSEPAATQLEHNRTRRASHEVLLAILAELREIRKLLEARADNQLREG